MFKRANTHSMDSSFKSNGQKVADVRNDVGSMRRIKTKKGDLK